MKQLSRRAVIGSGVAGAAVLGFNCVTRSWVISERFNGSFESLPSLDGTLKTSPQACAAAADDFGGVFHREPLAVLAPGSVQDIVKMVRFCRTHGLKIACRGEGHTTSGQSLAAGGVVIEMRSLARIHSIDDDHADVDAGVLWRELLLATTPRDLTPPVLTDFLWLTIGGTLSVGGVSGSSFLHGAQVDNVLSLEVVTGDGQHLTCSATRNADLFQAALAGLGQCGIIVRATVRLIPAKRRARTFLLFYADLPSLIRDMRRLVGEGSFDYVAGSVVPGPSGWLYVLEAVRYHSPPENPSATELLSGLSFVNQQERDQSYFERLDRVTQLRDSLIAAGTWRLPHPWCDLFVPGSKVDAFVGDILANSTPQELGMDTGLPILLYPFHRKVLTRRMFRVPAEDSFFLFDILRTAKSDPDTVARMLAHNRKLYDRNRDLGGTHYVINTVSLSPGDWRRHYHTEWDSLMSAKRRYDPDNILTPSPGIFR